MNPKSKTSSILFIIFAFIAGIIIGLVVLGWGLWPVKWTGASFDALNSADQQNFLRAAIESYAYNPDEALAQQRYTALGDQNARVLSDILASPGNLEKSDVEKFANVVKAQLAPITTNAAAATPVPVTTPARSVISSVLSIVFNRPNWMNICLPVGMLFVVIFVILMIILSRRNKKSANTKSLQTETMESGNTGTLPEISDKGQSGEVQASSTNTGLDSAIPVETDLPDWLREVSDENQLAPTETKVEEPGVELSDSDIKEITTSKFSTLETKPAKTIDSAEFNQAIISSSAFVPDESKKTELPAEPEVQPVKQEPQLEPARKVPAFQETKEETFAKFSRDIELTPGINSEDASKLRSIGITAPLLLLKKGATPQGRQSIAAGIGIPDMQVLKWVNFIDLLRIKGLSLDDAQMLKAAGIDILVELATREPENLLEKLVTSSKTANPSYKIPSLDQVQNWITQARELPRIISYS